jgi:hypothetical protein
MVKVKVLPGCAISDNGIRKGEGVHGISSLEDALMWEKGGHLIILDDSPEIQEALESKPEVKEIVKKGVKK